MPSTPAIAAVVTITATSIGGTAVAKTFSNVIGLKFDYFKGMVRVTDSVQGEFYFSLLTPTTITYTVGTGTATITIS